MLGANLIRQFQQDERLASEAKLQSANYQQVEYGLHLTPKEVDRALSGQTVFDDSQVGGLEAGLKQLGVDIDNSSHENGGEQMAKNFSNGDVRYLALPVTFSGPEVELHFAVEKALDDIPYIRVQGHVPRSAKVTDPNLRSILRQVMQIDSH